MITLKTKAKQAEISIDESVCRMVKFKMLGLTVSAKHSKLSVVLKDHQYILLSVESYSHLHSIAAGMNGTLPYDCPAEATYCIFAGLQRRLSGRQPNPKNPSQTSSL